MGAVLCGARQAVETPASTGSSEVSNTSQQKVEEWLLESRSRNQGSILGTEADKNTTSERTNSLAKTVSPSSAHPHELITINVGSTPSSRPSSAKTDGKSSPASKQGEKPQQLWKNVRNVVRASNGLQEKEPISVSSKELVSENELEVISDEHAKALRSEFESISAPKATMDFQKLQKLQVLSLSWDCLFCLNT
jgi:hypothetical protein